MNSLIGVFIGAIALLMLAVLTALVSWRRPPGSLWPALPCAYGSAILWIAGSLILTRPFEDQTAYHAALTGTYLAALLTPATWWILSFRFEQLLKLRRRSPGPLILYAPCAIAVVHFLLLLTNPFHELFMRVLSPTGNVYGPFWFTQAIVAFLIVLTVIARYMRMYHRLSRPDLRAQTLVMGFASIAPLPFNLAYTTGFFDPGVDPTSFGLAISGALFYFGIYRYRLFSLNALQMESLMAYAPEALFLLDESGKIVDTNRRAEKFMGSEVCRAGEPFFERLEAMTERDEGSSSGNLRSIQHSLLSGKSKSSETHLRFHHPTWRHGIVRIAAIHSRTGSLLGLGAAIQDVTALIETRRQLSDVEEAFKVYLESLPDPVFIHYRGEIHFANEAAAQFLGSSIKDILARPGIELLHPDEREPAVRRQASIEKGGESGLREIRYLRSDGTSVYGEVRTVPTTFRGHPAILVSVRDLTERKQAEERRRQFEEQEQRRARLESLGVFAGGVAHDFNNILMGISGSCEMILQKAGDHGDNRKWIQNALDGVERAADLVRQIMAYAGKNQFMRIPLAVEDLVKESVEEVRSKLPEGSELGSSVEGSPMIWGDRGQISRVLKGLLVNACEALGGKRGSIDIRVRTTQITEANDRSVNGEDSLPDGEYSIVEIEDSGCGIPEAERSRIFEPFFSTKFVGRGLGLSAALGIVRAHGGTIQVESNPGVGSLFRVLLPAGSPALPQPALEAKPSEITRS